MLRTEQEQQRVVSEQQRVVSEIERLRTTVRAASIDSLRAYMPLVQQQIGALKADHKAEQAQQAYQDLLDDLRAFLKSASDRNDAHALTALQQVSALLGEQQLLLDTQSAALAEEEIEVPDDSDLISELTDTWDFSTASAGQAGIKVDAGKVQRKDAGGDYDGLLKTEWNKMGLLPEETELQGGDTFG